jgi:hypothetical protein
MTIPVFNSNDLFTRNETAFIIGSTVLFFSIVNLIVMHFYTTRLTLPNRDERSIWRFKNTFISWFHSLIASFLIIAK